MPAKLLRGLPFRLASTALSNHSNPAAAAADAAGFHSAILAAKDFCLDASWVKRRACASCSLLFPEWCSLGGVTQPVQLLVQAGRILLTSVEAAHGADAKNDARPSSRRYWPLHHLQIAVLAPFLAALAGGCSNIRVFRRGFCRTSLEQASSGEVFLGLFTPS